MGKFVTFGEIMFRFNPEGYLRLVQADKLEVSSQMFDRGILSTNDVMDIWQLPHVPDGDKRYIRKEYTEISQLELNATKKPPEPGAEPKEGDPNADT